MNAPLRALLVAAAVALPVSAAAQQSVNPIHPAFTPFDAHGNAATRAEDISATMTCSVCHDARYIDAHTMLGAGSHEARGGREGHGGHGGATCIQCHADQGRLDVSPRHLDKAGQLVREAIKIGTPRPANCASCHGLIGEAQGVLVLPPELEGASSTAGRTWSLTLGEGAIVSPQRMSDSFLDLQGKSALAIPWDVHAAKLVECTSCHYARNNPARARVDDKQQELRYVTADPRRQSTAEFLVRPDHQLAEPGCRSCHDALSAHDFLPYRERHLEVLACQTCHIPAPMGPVADLIDATVSTLSGGAAVHYRNVERRNGEPLNAALIRPFQPLLIERVEPDGVRRLTPVNLVSRYRWISGSTREAVPAPLVAAAFLEQGRYAPAVLEGFDGNHDGLLDDAELRLDTPAKTALITARLAAAGVAAPTIEGTLETHPLAHGVAPRSHALRDCDGCHAAGSRLSAAFPVVPFLPGGVAPLPPDGGGPPLAGKILGTPGGGLTFLRETAPAAGRMYVLGATRHAWSNRLGFLIFLAVALGVTGHGSVRYLMTKRAGHVPHAPHATGGATEKVRVFGRYERLWHWTMAGSGLVLIVTGLGIHNAGSGWMGTLPKVVLVHNAAAVVLTVNAFLSLFYHLATVAIRSFIPEPVGFMKRVLEHVSYQSRGIFVGAPHPPQAATEKLNPLQQVTYLALLNVLFPVQIVSGTLIWVIGRWPTFAAALGGLSIVAPVHNFGAWLFLSFFVLHAYLVTTGRTVGDHLQSMVTGYRTVESEEQLP